MKTRNYFKKNIYKHILLLFLLVPLISSSQVKFDHMLRHQISDDYEMQLLKLKAQRGVDIGMTHNGGTVYRKAEKGYKIIELNMRIKNVSDSKKILDLTQFQVVDENSDVYEADICAGNGVNKNDCKGFEFKIKPNKRRLVRINFAPLIPKNVQIKHLRFNGVNIMSF